MVGLRQDNPICRWEQCFQYAFYIFVGHASEDQRPALTFCQPAQLFCQHARRLRGVRAIYDQQGGGIQEFEVLEIT